MSSKLVNPIKAALVASAALFLQACGEDSKEQTDSLVQTPERDGPSVARQWNEMLLDAIRNDYARPTVHARNLYHISSAMYDSWAAYDDNNSNYFFGKQLGNVECPNSGLDTMVDIIPNQEEALSFAAYRLITYRFKNSPGSAFIQYQATELMKSLDLDPTFKDTDYTVSEHPAAALGNYIASCYIEYGHTDGANEDNDYANQHYQPLNPNLQLNYELSGNPDIIDMNRWQRIELSNFIDQAGNPVTGVPEFLGAEWGDVEPFALNDSDKTVLNRDGYDYSVFFDPGTPPQIGGAYEDEYKWGFSLVGIWSAHLDPNDGVMIDISPASMGNIKSFPTNFSDFADFYSLENGGDTSSGYDVNPVTGLPYEPQMVPRGDYGRVLAEFWADGPDSETPPGHWFYILNHVMDHELFERRWAGTGDVLGNLEYDVKAYFSLGGTMHDAAISAWSIKGYYDYIRPVSAIRAMVDLGQSSDPELPSYHEKGIPLVEGHIELVEAGDPLAGENNEHVGKIKMYAWKGPAYIDNPNEDVAGVDWILAETWWPYQRPSFVTPPFAGYVSGHSTFSRSAAELLTRMTGSEYFPGGMSEFTVKANDFLVFEKGPSVDLTLQWATYQDASDQCSLSRIWGGIHPPADDIPGRLIGLELGERGFNKAQAVFAGE